MQKEARYSVLFAALVCLVCAIVVSTAKVSLSKKQEFNAYLDKRRNVLIAAGLTGDQETLTIAQVEEKFRFIRSVVVDLETGKELVDIDPMSFDQRKASVNPEMSRNVMKNFAGVTRVPHRALVYRVEENGKLALLILPIEGRGLWSTLYGFIALDADLRTIQGLTFYEHKETPGLGGEVDNPQWKALWLGRQAFAIDDATPRIEVIRGQAGPPSDDPYRVDGISGATITSRGVSNLVRFWLGGEGFGKYLDFLRTESRN